MVHRCSSNKISVFLLALEPRIRYTLRPPLRFFGIRHLLDDGMGLYARTVGLLLSAHPGSVY